MSNINLLTPKGGDEFYESVTLRSLNIIGLHAQKNGDWKLVQYYEKHWDELTDKFTPIIKKLINDYFKAPLHGEPTTWADPWDVIYDQLPWSEIEKEVPEDE